jgi:hypothetical protein
MAPFEVLYGCGCRTTLNWIEPGEKVIFGPDLVEEAEVNVHCIQDNLKATKSRQETYVNKRRRPLAFDVGDHVYLVCIISTIKFEFQIQTRFFYSNQALFVTYFVTRFLTYKCSQLNSLL